jgi:HEPN superfamily AbiU2-like protein
MGQALQRKVYGEACVPGYMSPKAQLVKQISATGFTEAIDLMACLAVLREGESLVVPQALEAANAARAATIVQKALLQRVLMTVERAFAPVNRPNSDRHARVAFDYLSDTNIFDEVADAGSRKHLQQACAIWRKYDADPRRQRLKHYRDRVVAHTGAPNPAIPVPLISDLRGYAMGTADVLGRLARGSGVVGFNLRVQTTAYVESAKAFWNVWREREASARGRKAPTSSPRWGR